MRNYIYGMFIFFLCSLPVAQGQTTYPLIEKPSTAKVADAKATMDAIKDSPVNMGIGGYALIQIKVTTKLTVYPVPGSNDCLETLTIPKGAVHRAWYVPENSKEWVYVTIAADKDYDRLLVTGTVKGTATILWLAVVNNEPVVVAGYRFDVAGGKPTPPDIDPPAPIDDPTTKALRAALAQDRVKGLANPQHLLALSGIYEAASHDSLESVKTAGELDTLLNNARVAAGIPEADKALPEVRQWIKRQLLANIATDAAAPLTPATRKAAKELFARFAASLEVLAK